MSVSCRKAVPISVGASLQANKVQRTTKREETKQKFTFFLIGNKVIGKIELFGGVISFDDIE